VCVCVCVGGGGCWGGGHGSRFYHLCSVKYSTNYKPSDLPHELNKVSPCNTSMHTNRQSSQTVTKFITVE